MKSHKHNALIKNFCDQIKHRLFETRKRRRQKVHEAFTERKIKWTLKMCIKLFEKKKRNDVSFDKIFIKFFLTKWRYMWRVYQTRNRRKVCETLLKNITFNKIKLQKNLTKLKDYFVTHMRIKRIELIDYVFFRRVFTVLFSSCICDHSRQTFKHVLLFCANWFEKRQRMLREKRTTNMQEFFNSKKKLRVVVNWLMKINLLIQFSLIKEYFD
jgi:hypothetical protein